MINKYRCETCESNLKEKAEGDSIWCAKSEEWLVTRHAQRIINELGCASHSDYENTISLEELLTLVPKIEQECRKDEQEKALDEAILIIEKRIAGIFDAYRGETNEIIVSRPYAMADGMGECILMLKTIRSSKPEET
jgi:hypothetical protein